MMAITAPRAANSAKEVSSSDSGVLTRVSSPVFVVWSGSTVQSSESRSNPSLIKMRF